MIRVFLLFFFSLSFALLSVEEIQKRINEAYEKEVAHIDSERLSFVNTILPILEEAIIKGRINAHFGPNGTNASCDGYYNDIRPEMFCKWWSTKFNQTICTYTTALYCRIGIGFMKE